MMITFTHFSQLETILSKKIVNKIMIKGKKVYSSFYALIIISIFLISTLSTVSLMTGNTFFQPTQTNKDQSLKQATPSNTGHSSSASLQQISASNSKNTPSNSNDRTTIKTITTGNNNNNPIKQSAIPTYTGTVSGSGTTQLKMNETLDTTTTVSNFYVNNSFTTYTPSNSTSIKQSLSGYTNTSGTYQISNVQAVDNYKVIANNTSSYNSYSTGGSSFAPKRIAQPLTITDNEVNITQLKLFYAVGANGYAYISGTTSGVPNATQYGKNLTLTTPGGDGWAQLTISTPVMIPKGT